MMQRHSNKVSLERHARYCKICRHEQREAIEQDFIAWHSPEEIARDYRLADRRGVYRHAHATGLFEKRDRNIRAALSHIIEQAGAVEVTAAAVVSAVQAYAKINAQGHWVERSEHVNLNELFERMSTEELLAYAERAELPEWFGRTVSVPVTEGKDEED